MDLNKLRVEIDDIDRIPERYLVHKEEIKPDKNAIKKAFKDGESVDGTHIEKLNNIQIK